MLAAHFGDPDKAFPGAGQSVANIDIFSVGAKRGIETVDRTQSVYSVSAEQTA